jgi:hypothetical protein
MKLDISLIALASMLLAGCGGGAASGAQAPASTTPLASAQSATSADASHTASAASASASAGSGASSAGGATRELVNPDASTMVFLYYELAHLPLPIDTWVEEDSRVRFAPAPDKAARRVAVRAELESAAASVRGVGALRLTMNANLSEYDPSYGEFTVRALSPSSVVNFDALGQKVAVSFTNGRTAQIWRVPQAEAQGIRDKISYSSNVEMDALLRIANVLPGPGGGTLATEVIEYELRETQRGVAIARVQLANR